MRPLADRVPRLGWREIGGGTLDAEAGPFRLVVHARTAGGYARFLLLRRTADGNEPDLTLVGSGTRDGVQAAIDGAEQAAARMIAALGRGKRKGAGQLG